MKTAIWKFPIPMHENFTLKMPIGAKVLSVQLQGARPTLWAVVEQDAPQAYRGFYIMGTGQTLPENHGQYLGTWQQDGFVWHLFEDEPYAEGSADVIF